MADPDGRTTTWHSLVEPRAAGLLEALRLEAPPSAATIRRLRRDWPADLVAAAVELTRAREKAVVKFPDQPDLVADVPGIEQASSALVADHKARRFAAIRLERILDLCCGIGGDAMSLTRVSPVLAIDCDSLRAWMTARNAGCEVLTANVETLEFQGETFHLDPSRRDDAGARHWHYRDYRPGPAFIDRWLADNPDGAIKLGPGVEFDLLPRDTATELEIINERGTLTQAILWTGRLAFNDGKRTATRLPENVSFTERPETIPLVAVDRFIFAVDPAIERADLLGALARRLGTGAPHPKSGLLTAPDLVDSPWLAPFELLADLPWRQRKVKAWLREHDSGDVVIRTRGKAVDPDALQKALRGHGDTPYTIFIQRFDEKVRALVCRRI